MIKTIKVKKQLRLDELIKYVWDNDVQNEMIRSKESDILVLVEHGRVFSEWTIDKYETFTVEVEEEITEDTVFKSVVGIIDNDEIMLTNLHTSVNGIQKLHGSMKEIHAVINGKLEKIWEAE